jgi:RsiW-degrading membrane proteinase PrsW (M82 family)
MWLEIFISLFFSLLPTLIWLLFYLKRDPHPEPKKKIFFAFLGGYLVAFFAFFCEQILVLSLDFFISYLSLFIILLAFFEEFLKLLVFKKTIEKDKDYDEPVDAMIYLISISLGFAATENLFDFFKTPFDYFSFFQNAYSRFFSSVFLHGLTGAILGFFIGLSFYKEEKIKKKMTLLGFFLASFFHALYNLAILKDFANIFIDKLVIIFSFLTLVFIFVILGFRKIKKLKK